MCQTLRRKSMKVQYKDKEIEIEKPERVIEVLKEECTRNTIGF